MEVDEDDFDPTTDMKAVLDERLLEDEETYLSVETSINQLQQKYDLQLV